LIDADKKRRAYPSQSPLIKAMRVDCRTRVHKIKSAINKLFFRGLNHGLQEMSKM